MSIFPFEHPDVELTENEQTLPEEFWDMPETFISNERVRGLYIDLYKRLLAENPDRDTVETLLIERAAALYAYMRHLESTEGYRNSSDYRHLTVLWNQMANDLRKTRTGNTDVAKIREDIYKEFMEIILASLRGMDPEVANTVKRRMLNALGGTL